MSFQLDPSWFSPAAIEAFKEDFRKARLYIIAWVAVYLYDLVATLPQERRYVWASRLSPYKVFFLLNRYVSLFVLLSITAMTLSKVPPETCKRIYWISPFSGIWVVSSCNCIIISRLYALFAKRKPILYGLVIVALAELSVMIGTSTRLTGEKSSDPYIHVRAKDGARAGTIVAIFWTAPLVFDTVVLAWTLYRVLTIAEGAARMPLHAKLLEGQIGYFAVIASTNLVNVALIHQSNPILQTFNVTASVVLTSAMCSHMVLQLYSANDCTTRFSSSLSGQSSRAVVATLLDWPVTAMDATAVGTNRWSRWIERDERAAIELDEPTQSGPVDKASETSRFLVVVEHVV
ncbi:hypothetical protein JCM10212_005496 [Sporobolomyces blumeae]